MRSALWYGNQVMENRTVRHTIRFWVTVCAVVASLCALLVLSTGISSAAFGEPATKPSADEAAVVHDGRADGHDGDTTATNGGTDSSTDAATGIVADAVDTIDGIAADVPSAAAASEDDAAGEPSTETTDRNALSVPSKAPKAALAEQSVLLRTAAGEVLSLDNPIEVEMGATMSFSVFLNGTGAISVTSSSSAIAVVTFQTPAPDASETINIGGKTYRFAGTLRIGANSLGQMTATLTVAATETHEQLQMDIPIDVTKVGIDRLVADDEEAADRNTRVLQAAIDEANRQGGGTVALPAGTFYFGSAGPYGTAECCIVMKSNVTVRGAGQNATVLCPVGVYADGTAYQHGVDMFAWQGLNEGETFLVNADFADFTIDSQYTKGSQFGYNASGKGFFFKLFEDCDWSNVTVRNTDGTGFGMDFPINCTVVGCVAENCGKNASRQDVGASGFGIGTGFSASESILIQNCISTGNTKYGFFFEHQSIFHPDDIVAPQATGYIVRDCEASGNMYNFGGERAHDVTFERCTSAVDPTNEAKTESPFHLGDLSVRIVFENCVVQQDIAMTGGAALQQLAARAALSQNVIDGSSSLAVDLDMVLTRFQALELLWRTAERPGVLQIGWRAKQLFPYRDVATGSAESLVAAWCDAYRLLLPDEFPGYLKGSKQIGTVEFLRVMYRAIVAGDSSDEIDRDAMIDWAHGIGIPLDPDIFDADAAMTLGEALAMIEAAKDDLRSGYDASVFNQYDFSAHMTSGDFSDVPYTHWVVTEGWLDKVLDAGIMSGYADSKGKPIGKFGPNDTVTRAQLATVLYRFANPLSTDTTTKADYAVNATPFADNASRNYYTAAINWAYRTGIMKGDAGVLVARVRPNDIVTRQEAAAMLYRYAQAVGAPITGDAASAYASAPDASSVASWASKAVGWCYSNGIMTGQKTTGKLLPNNGASRAEIAKMAFSALQRTTVS